MSQRLILPAYGGTRRQIQRFIDTVSAGVCAMNAETQLAYARSQPLHTAADELFGLQVAQFRHDELYHREIARLTVHGRLNHMALHFCKYVGQLAEAVPIDDLPKIRRTVVDAFIIDLCSANALNIRLSAFVPGAQDARSLADLGYMHRRSFERAIGNRGLWLLSAYAVEAGKMARACEKIDHLEGYPFSEAISAAVGAICDVSLVAADLFEFDLVTDANARLAEVEGRFVFHNAL